MAKFTSALALLLASSSAVSGFTPSPLFGIKHTTNHQLSSPITTTTTTEITTTPISTTTSLSMARKRGRPRGPIRTIEVKPPMNAEIKYEELRVSIINVDNTSDKKLKDTVLGIMSKSEALTKAKELGGLDLILINENSDPPVAKIADYSKFRYQKEKKAKELKKNSKASELKEVKMSYKIDVHDYGVRIKNASKFIKQGNRVKCTVQFRGREVQHDKLGFQLLDRMAEDMVDICNMEGKPKREGRTLIAILCPKAEVTKAINDRKRKEDRDKKKNRAASKAKANGEDVVAPNGAAVAAAAVAAPVLTTEDEGDKSTIEDLLGSDDLTDDLFG
jgi:translation initiation factor IF-3